MRVYYGKGGGARKKSLANSACGVLVSSTSGRTKTFYFWSERAQEAFIRKIKRAPNLKHYIRIDIGDRYR